MAIQQIDTHQNNEPLPPPPGFASRTSFILKKEQNRNSSEQPATLADTTFGISDVSSLKKACRSKPWILYDISEEEPRESDSKQPDKVTVQVCSKDVQPTVFEEAPVFYPTEEDFNDPLKYIESIRLRAEPCGICRIIPPSCWQPPCIIKQGNNWGKSQFVSKIQRIGGSLDDEQKETSEDCENRKRPRSLGTTSQNVVNNENIMDTDEGHFDNEEIESSHGPEFTLKKFEKYADDFKERYFSTRNKAAAVDISLENVEVEYRRIVGNSTKEIEVLCGDNLDTETFLEKTDSLGHMASGWNLNNVPTLPGSLLSFMSLKTNSVTVPRLHIGMCFSSLSWKVEEHHLYSLSYLHVGAPRIWYCTPGKSLFKFDAAVNKYFSEPSVSLTKSCHNLMTRLSPSTLKSDGVPVFRCVQNPGEFVLVFPGAYNSALDCGFNCAENANLAPLDWLPHGQNAVELYSEIRRKTSISNDKLLLDAAREAVKAQWELTLMGKNTSKNLRWKSTCGKDGILAKVLKSRIKQEENKRKYLCESSQLQKMDENFNADCKRECTICRFDLHLSAVYCSCSVDKYACLNHTNDLCSCPWTEKIFLLRYDTKELNILVEAIEGNITALRQWAKTDPKLAIQPSFSKIALSPNSHSEKLTHGSPGGTTSNDSVKTTKLKEKMKARLKQATDSKKRETKKKKTNASVTPSGTGTGTSLLPMLDMFSEGVILSSSSSSSSDSDDSIDLVLPGVKKILPLSTCISKSIAIQCEEEKMPSPKKVETSVNSKFPSAPRKRAAKKSLLSVPSDVIVIDD